MPEDLNGTDLNTEVLDPKFTLDQLIYAKHYNEAVIGRLKLDQELANYKIAGETLAEQGKLSIKNLEMNILHNKESMRPYRMMGAYVAANPSDGNYVCQTPALFEDEDEDGRPPVVAYGDTPAQACDNFDHLWIFGDK